MKEMVGGCCVCSDERGWPENPLVYCDGQNCTVAVHQACYGIVTVPTGPWYCRKCESQERPARVRCELCPSRDGALKRTDNQGWAHVVCALYIPEVRFGNVTTMEPIILQLIPSERYAKTCYICQEIGKPNRANVGACMQCNKFNCKQQFHVTCAQSLGLLCEEAGNYLDNVKYCGYCQHHYSKLKKGGNVKTIPPYKPITHDSSGSDSGSSPEKEIDGTINATASSTSATSIKIINAIGSSSASTSGSIGVSSTKQRKSSVASKQTSSSTSNTTGGTASNISGSNTVVPANIGSSSIAGISNSNDSSSINSGTSINVGLNAKSNNSSGSSKEKEKHSKNLTKINSSKDKERDKEMSSSSSSSTSSRERGSKYKNKDGTEHGSSGNVVPPVTGSGALVVGQNITNVGPRSALGADVPLNSSDNNFPTAETVPNPPISTMAIKNSGTSLAKKRKADSKAGIFGDANDINHSFRDIIKDVSVTLTPLPLDKTSDLNEVDKISKKQKTELSPPTHQSTEPTIATASPKNLQSTKNQPQAASSASQTQNVTSVESSITSSTTPSPTPSNLKPAKEREDYVRSSSPFTSTLCSAAGTTVPAVNSTGSGSLAPSLYVSVPLSTANVPGLNLPTTTTGDHPTPSQSTRVASQPQSNIIERQSPRINQQVSSSPVASEHGSLSSLSSPMNPAVVQSAKSTSPSTTGGSLTATTTESGNLKISYEKQNSRVAQLQEQESAPVRRSRTPDSGIFSSSFNIGNKSQQSILTPPAPSSNGGLKFSYEPQTEVPTTAVSQNIDTILVNNTAFKDSPPSSPASETGSARKRGRKSNEMKDVKVFQNGSAVSMAVTAPTHTLTTNGPMHASHMLGNQLNPTSSVAQKLTDQLHMEMQDHSVYTESQAPQFVGVPFPSKPPNNVRNTTSIPSNANSLASMFGGNGGGYAPQSLEQLLERQWEQGSQFLMEQAQHFDIASLLSCLHQLQTENVRLEEHVNSLIARRDHLLAVNARLAIPLNANVPQSQVNLNNIHQNGPTQTEPSITPSAISHASVPSTVSANTTPTVTNSSSVSRSQRSNVTPSPAIENGIDFRQSSAQQPIPVQGGSTAVSAPSLTQSSSSVRHSSSVHPNLSNPNSSSSSAHPSHHSHNQHQPHQHHQHQQHPPSLAQQSTMSSSASNMNSLMTSTSRQIQQSQHTTQPQNPHQQAHHSQHQSQHAQQLQQQQQSHHSQHHHSQHQSNPLVQHSLNHHHPSSTGTSASTAHHMQQQHHQMPIPSNEGTMRVTGTRDSSGSGRPVNSSCTGVSASQILSGRQVHNENSAYHPVYSQTQLRRDEAQGKTS